MGEIAEMMLDGSLCEGCGEFMGEACDFPRLCHRCAQDRRKDGHKVTMLEGFGLIDEGKSKPAPIAAVKVKCPTCGKRVKEVGLKDHLRDAHK